VQDQNKLCNTELIIVYLKVNKISTTDPGGISGTGDMIKFIHIIFICMFLIVFYIGCNESEFDDQPEIQAMNTFCNPDTGTYNLSVTNGLDCFYHELNIKCGILIVKTKRE